MRKFQRRRCYTITDQVKYESGVPKDKSEGEQHEVGVEDDRVLSASEGKRVSIVKAGVRWSERLTRMWQPAMIADGRMAVIEVMRIASGRKGSDMTIMPMTSDHAKR